MSDAPPAAALSSGVSIPQVSIMVAPVVALAAFMEVLDISIANVSLQHIAGDLSATQDQSTWVLTSYMVTNAIILPIAGWMSTVVGRKRFFIASIIGFTLSSLLCGLAPNLPLLILFRAIQGLAGGGLQPMSQSILADSFPPRQRGMAFALFGVAVVFAPAIGPTLGGLITDQASWRWVFLINVPIGIMLVVLLGTMIEDTAEMRRVRAEKVAHGVRVDYPGFLLLALGFGCLQILLDKGQDLDWFSSSIILTLAVGAVLSLVGMVLWELGQDDPIVDVRLLMDRNFGISSLLMAMLGFVMMGSTVLLPIMVQSLFGYTATDAGLVISPGGFLLMFMMPVAGKLVSLVDSRYLVVLGMLITAVSMFACAGLSLDADYGHIMWLRALQSSGLAFLFIPLNTLAYRTLPPAKNAQAASLINVARNIGGAFGISLIVAQLARRSQVHQTMLVAHATPLDPPFTDMVGTLAQIYQHYGDIAATAAMKATGQVYGMIVRQASMQAFLDDFFDLGVLFTLLIPVIFVMRGGTMAERGQAPLH